MSDKGKGEFWAFLAGMLTGGIVALLYAPARGIETREKLRETAAELCDKGEEFYEKGRHEAEKAYEQGREKAAELRRKADEIAARGKEEAAKVVAKGRKKVEEIREKVAHDKAPEEEA